MSNRTSFEKVDKKFSINNSYWKNRKPGYPANPAEVLYYVDQYNELPYESSEKVNSEDGYNNQWLYECFVTYQKRRGVEHSQYFTPPATARRMADLTQDLFDDFQEQGLEYHDITILDACAGFGMLTNAISQTYELDSPVMTAFEFDYELFKILEQNVITENLIRLQISEAFFPDKFHCVISNPPYEQHEMLEFLEGLSRWLMVGGYAILLLPKGYIDKTKPLKLKYLLQPFRVVSREDMHEDFALTKIKAEIVVLQKVN